MGNATIKKNGVQEAVKEEREGKASARRELHARPGFGVIVWFGNKQSNHWLKGFPCLLKSKFTLKDAEASLFTTDGRLLPCGFWLVKPNVWRCHMEI